MFGKATSLICIVFLLLTGGCAGIGQGPDRVSAQRG